MEYVVPQVEVMGTGSELVQAMAGPATDWGAFALSLGFGPQNKLDEE